MAHLTNDELRKEFLRIYRRDASSMFELEQFRRNRPVSFYEKKRGKRKKRAAEDLTSCEEGSSEATAN